MVPRPERFQAAATSAEWVKTSDFDLLIIDAPGDNAYPLVVTVFAQMQKTIAPGRARDTLNFFQWSLDKGEKDAADLGYVPLPQELVTLVKQYWSRNLKAGS